VNNPIPAMTGQLHRLAHTTGTDLDDLTVSVSKVTAGATTEIPSGRCDLDARRPGSAAALRIRP
jgi:hypothetical protein